MDTTTSGSDSGLETVFKLKGAKLNKPTSSTCVICLKKNQTLFLASDKCLMKFKEAVDKRFLFAGNSDATISRLRATNFDDATIKWHRSCYASFISKRNICLLEKRSAIGKKNDTPNDSQNTTGQKRFRKSKPNFDVKKCVFCQAWKDNRTLSQVMTYNISNKITKMSKCDPTLLQKVSNFDLIALEVKYHSNCFALNWKTYLSNTKQDQNTSETLDTDLGPWENIINEIETGIRNNKTYSTDTVFNRYKNLGGNKSKKYFMRKLKKRLGESVYFLRSFRRNEHMLIFPNLTQEETVQNLQNVTSQSSVYKTVLSEQSFLSSLHTVAIHIKQDIKRIPKFQGVTNMNLQDIKKIVPESLCALLSLILCDFSDENKDNEILSIAQDIIFAHSDGKVMTPKHVAVGLAVHQATRSKKLINLLHSTADSISYKDVLALRDSIAQNEINNFFKNECVYIPKGMVPNRFLQFAVDNIDIIEETLDGKDTFHATQIAAFQRTIHEKEKIDDITIMPLRLNIPTNFHDRVPSNYNKSNRAKPIFENTDLPKVVDQKFIGNKNQNLAWVVARNVNLQKQNVPQWTGFNKIVDETAAEITRGGYLPIFPYVASEYDTVWTVMLKCRDIAYHLGIKHPVITYDQAIYCKAKELQWLNQDTCKDFVIRLGGFHIMLNFIKVIGQRMEDSGLSDILIESGIYNSATVSNILNGKLWNRAIRCHKLVYESLWRILLQSHSSWLKSCHNSCNSDYEEILQLSLDITEYIKLKHYDKVKELFKTMCSKFDGIKESISEHFSNNDPTFEFWFSYLDMIETLLCFIWSERTGSWDAHINSFYQMLPWFAIYDHNNYARWGPVYYLDMVGLPSSAPQVHEEFMKGNFVVKTTDAKFNQLSVDQALEHINRISKVAGGLIGITKNDIRRDEWCLSYNFIGNVIDAFNSTLGIKDREITQHIELGEKRLSKDEADVKNLVDTFSRFRVFSRNENCLVRITTNDVIPTEAEKSILGAYKNGMELITQFIAQIDTMNFYNTIKKNNIGSFIKKPARGTANVVKTKYSALKKGQDIIQRLLAATEGGRDVQYENVYSYELTEHPLSLTTNGHLSVPTNKSSLGHILQAIGNNISHLDVNKEETCLVIDGMSVVQSIGKPRNAKTFGDYARIFCHVIFANNTKFSRIDVVFDHYIENSVKNFTREKRKRLNPSIRKVVDNVDVPLPVQWSNFIHLWENKLDLTNFLSNEIMKEAIKHGYNFVTSGGYKDITKFGSVVNLKTPILNSTHEGTDTRILLHILSALDEGYKKCVVKCADTDVLVLLLHFRAQLTPELWIESRQNKEKNYIPVHKLQLPSEINPQNILNFHAFTGCDTTSQFNGIGKKTAWKVFAQHSELLNDVGETAEFKEEIFHNLQKFTMYLYTNSKNIPSNINKHRALLASKKSLESLPPTVDALKQHCLRVHYQTLIWKNALKSNPYIPDASNYGWTTEDNAYKPMYMTQKSYPKNFVELSFCSCKTGCSTKRCSCKIGNIPCLGACSCMAMKNCQNHLTASFDSSDDDDIEY